LKLQAVDTQLDAILKTRGELPGELATLSAEIADLEARALATQDTITRLEEDITRQRIHVKTMEALVKKYEVQQMNVRNNREYTTIAKEIDLQKLEIQLAEKKIKGAYEHVEAQKSTLSQTQVLLEKHRQVLADKQSVLQGLIAASEDEEKKLNKKRATILKRTDEMLLKLYERIRGSARDRIAVVTVQREACGGCFNKVPPQRQLDIQAKKHIIRCEHCGRILADAPALVEAP